MRPEMEKLRKSLGEQMDAPFGGGGTQMNIDNTKDQNAFVTFKKFMEFLTAEPAPDSICQYIVLNWPVKPPIIFAGLRLVSSDANLNLAGFFGAASDQVQPYVSTSLWENTPATRAIRERSPIVLPDRDAMESNDQEAARMFPSFRALIAVPLLTNFNTVGTLEVIFGEDLTDQSEIMDFLALGADALTLYSATWLARNQVMKPNNNHQPATNHHKMNGKAPVGVITSESSDQVPEFLTDRQLSILQFMAMKFTNRRIASRLGFSESTIRQETMTIYSFLNARGRKEAVEQAILLGLINQPVDF
jgi:DNA-binding NarL/FixJ family response regulator